MIDYIENLVWTHSWMNDLVSWDKCISNTLNDTYLNASSLENLRRDNLNKIIFVRFNINSIRNNFDQLDDLIKGKIDVLIISEPKTDDSLDSQFFLDGYSTLYRIDWNRNRRGIMFFVGNDIRSKWFPLKSDQLKAFWLN